MSCSMESKDRPHDAILWTKTIGADAYGRVVVSVVPTELKVRWKQVKRMGSDNRGNPVSIDAEVLVAQDVEIGSAMWQGKLDDLPGTAYVPEADVMKVVSFTKTPDIKGRYYERVLQLSRSADALPPTE